MKALLTKASDWTFHKNIEINNLNDLLLIGNNLIIEKTCSALNSYREDADYYHYDKDFEIVIKIYDSWVE